MSKSDDCTSHLDLVLPEVHSELYLLITAEPEASYKRMEEIAVQKCVTLTVEEVKAFTSRWMRTMSGLISSWMPSV